jgi:predicted DsbA family dithiol-disulfide isomerase
MRIDIWSDVVCPWCYIGKRRFETSLARFDHAPDVEVVWHSYELDPDAPSVIEGSLVDRLASKYGMSRERARQAHAHVSEVAAAEGLDFRLDDARHGNTFDAHRLVQYAATVGRQGETKERLMRAYFTEGVAVGDRAELVAPAVDAGLDETEVRRVLAGDAFGDAVRDDEAQARAIGVRGVPFFVVDGRYGVSGAQPATVFDEVLRTSWAEAQGMALTPAGSGGGCACGGGGCCG